MKTTLSLTRLLSREMRDRVIRRKDLDVALYYTLDVLGSYVAGGVTDQGQKLREYHRINTLKGVEAEAFLAAALCHITETDDLHRSSVTHPGCVVIPAALEMARHLDLTGKMALEAVVVGYEVMIRIGDALGDKHYTIFHNTATAGVFGAAAAAAYLLELNEDQWVWALGNAGTQAAGLWQFNVDATMSKHLHAGHAAQSGIRAALLAMRGFTGPEQILEGEKGFFKAMCPDARPHAVTRKLRNWRIAETSIKPYPSCRHTHPAIDVALDLREQLRQKGHTHEDIQQIRIRTYATSQRFTDNQEPETTFAAKFSIQYCVTTSLINGFPVLSDFEGERLHQLRTNPLLKLMQVQVDEGFSERYPKEWGSAIEITLLNGYTFKAETFAAKGDPEKPVTQPELRSKILGEFTYAGLSQREGEDLYTEFEGLCTSETIPQLVWNKTKS
ncbi:MAG: MmgE/PrpD family protein [Bacteroidetes bacterium]|nr:MmgE/PrpD family protein [Bacteroidota bacterium]MCH8524359.1 MmgE/PrpD family protein [Balneolales bacterium]